MGEASAPKASGSSIRKEILDDLCSRFLVNLPEVERSDPVRVCFQAELAHWFYLDHYCPDPEQRCRPVGIREFIRHLFHHLGYLKPLRHRVDDIVDEWRRYKSEVPTYGAALLSPCLRYILLVQGFYAKNSWGFPKGKVNEEEEPWVCAAREVYEEVGLDLQGRISKRRYLESQQPSHTRLYLVPNIPIETSFAPRTRKEIRRIQWFRLQDLPTSRTDVEPPAAIGMAPNNFYTVGCFVDGLRRWASREAAKKGLPDPFAFPPETRRSAFQPMQATAPLPSIPSPAIASLLSAAANHSHELKTILVYESTETPGPEAPSTSHATPQSKKARKKTKSQSEGRNTPAKVTNDGLLSPTWANAWAHVSVEELLRPWESLNPPQPPPPATLPAEPSSASPLPLSLRDLGLS